MSSWSGCCHFIGFCRSHVKRRQSFQAVTCHRLPFVNLLCNASLWARGPILKKKIFVTKTVTKNPSKRYRLTRQIMKSVVDTYLLFKFYLCYKSCHNFFFFFGIGPHERNSSEKTLSLSFKFEKSFLFFCTPPV